VDEDNDVIIQTAEGDTVRVHPVRIGAALCQRLWVRTAIDGGVGVALLDPQERLRLARALMEGVSG
jgi:hypothetical protein